MSFGRKGRGDGFLKYRRRLNVAISRAKHFMIVLLEETTGSRDGLVSHFRRVLRELAVEFVLPPSMCADAVGAALLVIKHLESTRAV